MSLLRLARAEWTKTRRRPMNRLVFWIAVGLGALICVSLGLTAWFDVSARVRLAEVLPWPANAQQMTEGAQLFAPLLAALFTASVVGSEYTHDTWKALLPRRPARESFLLVKLVCAYLYSLLAISSMLAVELGGETATARIFAIKPTEDALAAGVPLAAWTALAASVAVTCALVLLVTVATRSMLAGAGAGVLFDILSRAFAPRHPLLALSLPDVHLENVIAQLTGDRLKLDAVQTAFEAELTLRASVLTLLGYVVVSSVIALWIFRRRDLTSSTGG